MAMAIPPSGNHFGFHGATGIGANPPHCYGCGKINGSIKWVHAIHWPEWESRTYGTNICDKCYNEAEEIFKTLNDKTELKNLPLYISHPNGFVRLRAANLLQKN
jgi:hypothetical protein